ncbi:hypothetical protein [Nitrosomonas communis]|uniref:Uncharacterized protein n=1 Tax=Nitrosomonas communis TaxID=44574 RepID=A0A1H2PYQ2_9PROT|nr:hypothetical protein [Nitrosomonas communis]SDV99997.1 hypothetical protein SAMN05421882_1001126 [Nitrosomonas communis]
MNKKLIGSMFLAMTLLWAAQAQSEETESAESSQEAASSPQEAASSSQEAAPSSEETAAPKAAESLPSGLGWRVVRVLEIGSSGKFVHMVLVDLNKEMDKTVYSAAINQICGKATEFCRIRFWTQERSIPEKVTPTAEQLKQQKAEFLFNKAAGIRQTTWSCAVNPDKTQCVKY